MLSSNWTCTTYIQEYNTQLPKIFAKQTKQVAIATSSWGNYINISIIKHLNMCQLYFYSAQQLSSDYILITAYCLLPAAAAPLCLLKMT